MILTLIAGFSFSPDFLGQLKNKNENLTIADVSAMSDSNV